MLHLHIVGLGPGSLDGLSLGSWNLLNSGLPVLLRTARHPVVQQLQSHGLEFMTCDDLYEAGMSFDEVYEGIKARIDQLLAEHGTLVYAVPGHPLVAESTVRTLLTHAPAKGIKVSLTGSMSSLEASYQLLGIDPVAGLVIADALDAQLLQINPAQPLLFVQLYDRLAASELKLKLLDIYPAEWKVTLLRAAGTDSAETNVIPLWQLDHLEHDHLTSLFVPACPDITTASHLLVELMDIMERLRLPDGCPWDREQSHQSLKPYLLEESYEVLEAIDQGDMHKLADELGDLLLQVVFHAQIAKEYGEFDMALPIQNIVDKLKRRHPHVFGNVTVSSAAEVSDNWQAIKAKERGGESCKPLLDTVPKNLPALLQAYKIQQKAARVGFDWPDAQGAWDKVQEEIEELHEAEKSGDQVAVSGELGDLLFAVVNVARFMQVEPETALLSTIVKFRKRFAHIEARAHQAGKQVADFSLEQLDHWWNEAKS